MDGGVEASRELARGSIASRPRGDDSGPIPTPHFHDRRPQADGPRPVLSVVVPAYNEEARLGESLPAFYRYLDAAFPGFELIVVDDGSSDATAAIVSRFAAGHRGVELISYRPNRGKGHAVRVGMLRARGDLVLFSDADLATPIEEVAALAERVAAGGDIAIGSRAVAGSELTVRQPWYRELSGRTFNLMARALATPGLKDTQCGFKLFRREAAHDLFGRMTMDGFSFDIEVLHVAHRLGYSVAEVPVRWRHREGSKVRIVRDSARMFYALLRVRRLHRKARPSDRGRPAR